eukprot:3817526-Prymnesium_polylepis.1
MLERSRDEPSYRFDMNTFFFCDDLPIDHHPTRYRNPARHREMLSRAHDTAKRDRQIPPLSEAHPMRSLIARVHVRVR